MEIVMVITNDDRCINLINIENVSVCLIISVIVWIITIDLKASLICYLMILTFYKIRTL